MKKQEIIDELIEVGGCDAEEEWDKGYDAAIGLAISIVEKLNETEQVVPSKNETVEIPEAIAKYIRSQRKIGFDLQQTFYQVHTSYKNNELNKAEEWVDENQGDFATAWLYGYKIEQPKLLTVIVKDYDKTIMSKQMPADEVNKMMEGMEK